MRIAAGIISAIVGLFLFLVIFGSFYTVDEGERGVMLRNGAIVGTAEPGLGFKTPFIDSVKTISVQDRMKQYVDLEAYSRDQQPATLTVSVNYRLLPDQVELIYSQYGSEENVVSRLIDRQVQEKVKSIFGQFNAVSAIQERSRLNFEISQAIQNSVKGPVTVDSVQIEDVAFSEAYEKSIEARMISEVEVQKRQQELAQQKVQAEITVTQAKAQADAQVAEAEARAKATILDGEAKAEITRLAGEAEASAIRAKGEALRQNPDLIGLSAVENWNGILPTTMLPNSSVPFININSLTKE